MFRVLADSLQGSPERTLFELLYARLLDMVRTGVGSPDPEFSATCRDCLAGLPAAEARPDAEGPLFHHFGFLLARDMGLRLEPLGEDFARRYRLADLAYVRGLTESLGLPRNNG